MAIILPVFTLLFFLSKEYFIGLSQFFPECIFYKKTGFLCPACGNTRSIKSLLHGDILRSVGYNITPVLISILIAAFYIEIVIFAVGTEIHIIPRNYAFLAAILSLLILYYLLRNFIPMLTLC